MAREFITETSLAEGVEIKKLHLLDITNRSNGKKVSAIVLTDNSIFIPLIIVRGLEVESTDPIVIVTEANIASFPSGLRVGKRIEKARDDFGLIYNGGLGEGVRSHVEGIGAFAGIHIFHDARPLTSELAEMLGRVRPQLEINFSQT